MTLTTRDAGSFGGMTLTPGQAQGIRPRYFLPFLAGFLAAVFFAALALVDFAFMTVFTEILREEPLVGLCF